MLRTLLAVVITYENGDRDSENQQQSPGKATAYTITPPPDAVKKKRCACDLNSARASGYVNL
jgi:hypothetical protein